MKCSRSEFTQLNWHPTTQICHQTAFQHVNANEDQPYAVNDTTCTVALGRAFNQDITDYNNYILYSTVITVPYLYVCVYYGLGRLVCMSGHAKNCTGSRPWMIDFVTINQNPYNYFNFSMQQQYYPQSTVINKHPDLLESILNPIFLAIASIRPNQIPSP